MPPVERRRCSVWLAEKAVQQVDDLSHVHCDGNRSEMLRLLLRIGLRQWQKGTRT